MFFPAKKVHAACGRNLDDPAECRKAIRSLIGKADVVPDFPAMLRRFLRELPSPVDQRKIVNRFRKIARTRGAGIRDFAWWDIVQGERALFAVMTRKGQEIAVAFFWKKSVKGDSSARKLRTKHGWARDIGLSDGWRYEFEAPTYQAVKAHLHEWLEQPLAPMPPSP